MSSMSAFGKQFSLVTNEWSKSLANSSPPTAPGIAAIDKSRRSEGKAPPTRA
ncbi:MAG: hypothetical protein IPK16_29185 [Anaerolineales bacterium]|nr:hypothetical protein [Anaerolineales bacterium]